MACAQEAAQEVLHDVRKIEDPLLRQKVHFSLRLLLLLSLYVVDSPCQQHLPFLS